jgi:hypothetical protein
LPRSDSRCLNSGKNLNPILRCLEGITCKVRRNKASDDRSTAGNGSRADRVPAQSSNDSDRERRQADGRNVPRPQMACASAISPGGFMTDQTLVAPAISCGRVVCVPVSDVAPVEAQRSLGFAPVGARTSLPLLGRAGAPGSSARACRSCYLLTRKLDGECWPKSAESAKPQINIIR